MPKVTPSALFQAISGTIGGLVFHRDANGDMFVQRRGERRAPFSARQLARHELFKLAVAYGNRVKLDPALSAEYRPFCRGRMRPYHAALRDFLHPPTVAAIDLQLFTGQRGQFIRLIAADDTRVVGVQALIRHATTGAILEQGAAGLSVIEEQWLYTTTTSIPSGTPIVVEATAVDRPGNVGAGKAQFLVP